MRDSFDPFEYLDFLRGKTKLAVTVLGTALGLATAASLLLPKKYTATASIVIEPAAGGDPRTATAISPVYIESLKTYEQYALSDSLFARACARFGLLEGSGTPIESYKRRVLEVSKLKETKVLRIRATLEDPRRAQALAEFLARETVALSRSIAGEAESEAIAQARLQLREAEEMLGRRRSEAAAVAAHSVEAALEGELRSLSEQRTILGIESAETRARIAEHHGDAEEIRALQSRASAMEARQAAIEKAAQEKGAALALARVRREQADTQVRSADDSYEAVVRRVADMEGSRGTHGEFLRLIDPGTVPQRPSSPDLPLNLVAAVVLSGAGILAWTSLEFGIRRRRVSPQTTRLRVASAGQR